MKDNNQFLHSYTTLVNITQRVLDVLAIWGGLILVHYLADNEVDIATWYSAILVTIFYIMLAESRGVYQSWRGKRLRREIVYISLIFTLSIIILMLAHVYLPSFFILPGDKLLSWMIVSSSLLIMIRIVFRLTMRYLRKKGYNHKKVVIIGAGDLGKKIANTLVSNQWLGFDLVCFYDDFNTENVTIRDKDIVVKKDINNIVDNLQGIDRVYLTLPMRAELRIKEIIELLADSTVSVYLVPDIFTFELLHSQVEVVNGVPTVSIHESPFVGTNSLLKRIEDIILSSIILVLISIPLLLISLAVKLTSPGPVIFKQKRYGLDGRPIDVWKFRSMTVMENGGEVVQASKGDTRLTKIGGFLRRTSLDELPQFLNVLTGQMSIVGPRPHAVVHNEEYRKLVRGYMLRHKVKPGITGWAQINGWRGETDTLDKMEKRVEYDLYYIHNWSVSLDIKIILLTILKGFINKNAY